MKKLILIGILWCLPWFLQAQSPSLQGKVSDVKSGLGLPGATVVNLNTGDAVFTDPEGRFTLPVTGNFPFSLLVQLTSYVNDTLQISSAGEMVSVALRPVVQMKEAEIRAGRQSTEISTLQPRNIELLNEGELLKAACCNLSESFETNPSVDVNYTDAVTGAKEIQLLGLSGVYTQLLGEAIPTLRGMANAFGLMYVPGTWMESIQISKGAGSVSSGYEGITGQINVEFKKPLKPQPLLHLNLYADAFGRGEVNAIYTLKKRKSWNYMLMAHGSGMERKNDHNDDGFLDMPLYRQINLYNRLHLNYKNRLEGQFGVKTMVETRQGGATGFDEAKDKLTTNAYGIGIDTRRVEVYGKSGIVYPKAPYKSMGLQVSGIYHEQDAYFGVRTYDGSQSSLYINYIYLTMIGNTDHKVKTGVDFKYDYFDEQVDDSAFTRLEAVPGAYFEYAYSCDSSKFGAILGLRFDYHNLFGWLWTPRANLKYNFTDELILRLSAGKGYRTPNVYADNLGLFVSAKDLVVLEKPKMEEAWNGGVNLTTRFKLFRREGSLMLDAYRTYFIQQWMVDQYTSSEVVSFYNLNGQSTANSLQATLTYEPILGLTTKFAWRLDDVKADYTGLPDQAKPLIARNKLLFNLAFADRKEKWRFDATLQWEGPKQLPMSAGHSHAGEEHNSMTESPDYYQLMAQITRIFRVWEVYLGGENLLNYTQHQVILGSDNPFGTDFDATQVWGPVMGTRIYAGIRLNLTKI